MPGDPGATVVTNARAYYSTRAAAGATGTRHSPLPLGGESFLHNSGALRRGNADVCLRAPDAAQRAALAAWCAADPGSTFERLPMGPGSAVHREERCTASGTRLRFARADNSALCKLTQLSRRLEPFRSASPQ